MKMTGESRSTGGKRNLSPCQSVHHKSDNDWPDTEWPKKELFISDWAKHHDDVFGRVGKAADILKFEKCWR
jgi:hypothetical protein